MDQRGTQSLVIEVIPAHAIKRVSVDRNDHLMRRFNKCLECKNRVRESPSYKILYAGKFSVVFYFFFKKKDCNL